MQEIDKIPLLLKLAEAESAQVREAVLEELGAFCPHLDEAIAVLEVKLNPNQAFLVHHLNQQYREKHYLERWRNLLRCPSRMLMLESALDCLSQIQGELYPYKPVGWNLDRLATEYRQYHKRTDPTDLARFLFKTKGFKGVDEDYYNPLNSNLGFCLNEKSGLPITLSVMFMLVGYRLGLNIQGFNLPGHFMAQCSVRGSALIFDCFREGKVMDLAHLANQSHIPLLQLYGLSRNPPGTRTIICRILRNLSQAAFKHGKTDLVQLYGKLLEATQDIENRTPLANFPPGTIVEVPNRGARGIVVSVDENFEGDKQIELEKGLMDVHWYHVLIDGTDQCHYIPEPHIIRSEKSNQLNHPLISKFFTQRGSHYIRNETPWGGSKEETE